MNTTSNKKIAKNTAMLYVRQVLILIVGLYTVRVVLDVLGVENYGIYNVVAGVVALLTFLSGTMASATQRFFSFALGQNDLLNLRKVFSVNIIIYGLIAIIAFVLLETIGLWFVDTRLEIPVDKFEAAKTLYHFSIFTFLCTIFTAPFIAIIIAHEDMKVYAYVSIFESFVKLGIVFLLVYLPYEKLTLYGGLLFFLSLINVIVYIIICFVKYEECQFRVFNFDKIIFYEVIGFTGWTLYGRITTVLRVQAVTILLNQVYSPVVVAARAIAINVTNKINIFSNSFNVGLYPPIIKSYAQDKKGEMYDLIFAGSKITFFLMWVFSLPLFIEMDTILNLWLKNPPPEAILFTQLALIEVLIESVSSPLTTAARAPGKMKMYELTLGSFQILIFISCWIALTQGLPPESVFYIAIVSNLIMFIIRLLIIERLIGLSFKYFIIKVIKPIGIVILITTVLSYGIHQINFLGWYHIFIDIPLCMLLSTVSMYYIGLNKTWRLKIRNFLINKIASIKK